MIFNNLITFTCNIYSTYLYFIKYLNLYVEIKVYNIY